MSGARAFDARRLDVAAFASEQATLAGDVPLSALPRLAQDALPAAPGHAVSRVTWSAQGEQRLVAGAELEVRLRLQAGTSLQLQCQRCLQPMTVVLDIRPCLRFVQGEARAEQLDEDSEDDVLALGPPLDLQELIEDELILALPLVPRHAHCPQPLPLQHDGNEVHDADTPAHPFAALAALRRKDNAAD